MDAGATEPAGQQQDEPSPLVRIRALLPGLARAEQRVAQVVLADPAAVAHRSITEVAEQAGTSETTVTRFCKAIGIGGYPQLRISLAADAARTAAQLHRPMGADIAPDESLADIVAKVAFADARAVEETAGQLDVEILRRVVEALAGAPRVDLYGVGASAFVAQDFQHKLHRIGRVVFAWNDMHLALASAAMLRPEDVAMGISHTGATIDILDALDEARHHGATTVALTNFPRSPIAELADYVLTTAARETTFRAGALSSRVAQLTIMDCLFTGVAQQHIDTAREALQSARDAVRGRQAGARPDRRRTPRAR